MTEQEKSRLLELGELLSTLGVEFRIAQIGLEKMVEEHGLASPEAGEASILCGDIALRFSKAEEEFLALKGKLQGADNVRSHGDAR